MTCKHYHRVNYLVPKWRRFKDKIFFASQCLDCGENELIPKALTHTWKDKRNLQGYRGERKPKNSHSHSQWLKDFRGNCPHPDWEWSKFAKYKMCGRCGRNLSLLEARKKSGDPNRKHWADLSDWDSPKKS